MAVLVAFEAPDGNLSLFVCSGGRHIPSPTSMMPFVNSACASCWWVRNMTTDPYILSEALLSHPIRSICTPFSSATASVAAWDTVAIPSGLRVARWTRSTLTGTLFSQHAGSAKAGLTEPLIMLLWLLGHFLGCEGELDAFFAPSASLYPGANHLFRRVVVCQSLVDFILELCGVTHAFVGPAEINHDRVLREGGRVEELSCSG